MPVKTAPDAGLTFPRLLVKHAAERCDDPGMASLSGQESLGGRRKMAKYNFPFNHRPPEMPPHGQSPA